MRLEFLENGPIRVEGKRFVVRVGEKEEVLERPRVFLCRCGGSGNKPFCDGAHKRIGFQAPGGVPATRGRLRGLWARCATASSASGA